MASQSPASAGRESAGAVMGLIGFGSIGQSFARLARSLGMSVIAYDPALPATHPAWQEIGVQPKSLEQITAEADVISLHVPLLDATRNLFDATRIAAMKPGAVLINTSRGGIANEAAVVAALKSGALVALRWTYSRRSRCRLPQTGPTARICGVDATYRRCLVRGQHPCLVDDRCRSH